jgi:hypothetical protein
MAGDAANSTEGFAAPPSGVSGLLWESSYAPEPVRRTAAIAPCHAGGLLAGTRLRTAAGEVLVQALRVGDAVLTYTGLRRQVKWIGQRAYNLATLAGNPHLRPVLFHAGSLGPGLPRVDLRLAPMHMLLVDDDAGAAALVPAAALVNGVSILREPVSRPVAYLHVELNSHDILLAEGAAVETFADAGNRAMFHNAGEFAALYPRHVGGDMRAAVRRLEEGYALEHIRRRFAALAGADFSPPAISRVRFDLERRRGVLEGWAIDEAAPDVPVELDILLDGQRYARLAVNRYRPDLDHAGLAGGRCGFTCALPTRGGHIAIRRLPISPELATPVAA